ncbi:MAG TPA: hypothetical protein VKP89_02190 [Burkholderiales bacterium]|nr:hypothetical protein [Burkholderiales bacterium]
MAHVLAESYAVMIEMRPLYVQQELEADYIGFVLVATRPSGGARLCQARVMLDAMRRLYASAQNRP